MSDTIRNHSQYCCLFSRDTRVFTVLTRTLYTEHTMLCDTFDEMFSSPQYISPHHMNMYSIYVCLSVHPPTVLTQRPTAYTRERYSIRLHLRCALTLCTLRCALTLHTLALVLCMHMQRLSKRLGLARGPADSVDPHALNP